MRTFSVSGILPLHRCTAPCSKPPARLRERGHVPWHDLAGPTGASAYEAVDRLVDGGLFDVDPRVWMGLQLAGVGLSLARRLKVAWLERQLCCIEGACAEHRPRKVNAADV